MFFVFCAVFLISTCTVESSYVDAILGKTNAQAGGSGNDGNGGDGGNGETTEIHFVAVGGGGRIMTSPDGATWTDETEIGAGDDFLGVTCS
jgi:hypothetical protein